MARSTVYSVLDTLRNKGLAVSAERGKTTTFSVASAETLLAALSAEERQMQAKRTAVEVVAQELSKLAAQDTQELPRFKYVVGRKKLEAFLYENLPRWRESILRHDRSTWGYQDHTFVEQFEEWLAHAWKVLHVDAGIKGSILSNRSSVEKRLRGRVPKREVRFLGSNLQFESTTWVMGDYVIIIVTRKSPMYAVQIFEPALATNQRVLFQQLYREAKGVGGE